MLDPKLDLSLGWRGVPGWLSDEEAEGLQACVRAISPAQAYVELGAWCGRSLAATMEASRDGVSHYTFDSFPVTSQAVDEAGFSATQARDTLLEVVTHYRYKGKRVCFFEQDSTQGALAYAGPPICVLFVDDHHSADQVISNLKCWGPHLSYRCAILFHDYASEPFGLAKPINELLRPPSWEFRGVMGSMGLFVRI